MSNYADAQHPQFRRHCKCLYHLLRLSFALPRFSDVSGVIRSFIAFSISCVLTSVTGTRAPSITDVWRLLEKTADQWENHRARCRSQSRTPYGDERSTPDTMHEMKSRFQTQSPEQFVTHRKSFGPKCL